MTNLDDYVEPLKRALAVPGEFASIFPSTSNDDLIGSLSDAFAEAQLDGFFGTMSLNVNAGTVTPNLSVGGSALVVIYASIRICTAQLRNLKTRQKYEAGGAVYEVEQAASVLTEELKAFRDRKKQLQELAVRAGRSGQAVYVTDGYLTRVRGYFPTGYFGELGGFFDYELSGALALA